MSSHSVLKEQLIEMGFEEKLIQGALNVLKENATLEAAIESIENGTAAQQADKPPSPLEPNKELTAEEKEAKKKAMEERIRQRRLEIEMKEKEEERLKEKKRIEMGKEAGKMREELEDIQRKRLAEEIRKEKEAEKAAKDRILRAIEQDKLERKAKFGQAETPAAPAVAASAANLTQTSTASKDGKTRLAIRMLDGSQIVQEFKGEELLSSVRAFIVSKQNIDFNITFAMSPKPAFNEDDMHKSLFALGLVPSARLHVVKR